MPLALIALVLPASLLGGCGDDDGADAGTNPVEAPSPSAFPKSEGTLEDLAGEIPPTNQLVASPSGAVFVPSPEPQRFGFGLFNVNGSQLTDAEVAVYAAPGPDGEMQGPFPARIESLKTEPAFVARTTADDPESAKVVYVSELVLDQPGEWRVAAVIRTPDGLLLARMPSIVAQRHEGVPAPGERAPRVHTPTLAEVGGDISSIDTRVPPSSMHEDDLAEVLGNEPVVLLFATPALCVTRVCGPVVDVAEQVKASYDDQASFIFMEIYEDNQPGPNNLRPQVRAYGLPTEPWLFVIDDDGRVASRIEGAFSVAELQRALEAVVS